METIFTENWEQRLEMQFLKNGRCRKRAYICSPLSAEKDVDFLRNMHSARAYMYYAFEKMEMYARAPHAYLPMLLCDRIPSERDLALNFGLSLLGKPSQQWDEGRDCICCLVPDAYGGF